MFDLIHLILGLMKVLMMLLMFATHELPARSSTNAADAKAKASSTPSPRGKAPALPSSLAPPKGATGSKASSKASTAPSPKSKASPSPSPKAKALTLTVPKAQSKAQAAPVSPRSALAKAMAPKAKASGQHSDGVGRGANLIFWGLIEDHTQNSAFWFKIQGWVSQVAVESLLTLAPSCSQHLPTDNEFANHQRHVAPRFKVSFIEKKSAGQMGDTTAGPASLLNAMAKAGNPCCACITAVYICILTNLNWIWIWMDMYGYVIWQIHNRLIQFPNGL